MDETPKMLTTTLSPSTYRALVEIAHGRTLAEALRDCITIALWFTRAQRQGRVLEERGGKLYRIAPIEEEAE